MSKLKCIVHHPERLEEAESLLVTPSPSKQIWFIQEIKVTKGNFLLRFLYNTCVLSFGGVCALALAIVVLHDSFHSPAGVRQYFTYSSAAVLLYIALRCMAVCFRNEFIQELPSCATKFDLEETFEVSEEVKKE
jgi:hypothetical protein